ncbi:hypothetical protein WA158_008411 [Blastocystis sp. Blastoise]
MPRRKHEDDSGSDYSDEDQNSKRQKVSHDDDNYDDIFDAYEDGNIKDDEDDDEPHLTELEKEKRQMEKEAKRSLDEEKKVLREKYNEHSNHHNNSYYDDYEEGETRNDFHVEEHTIEKEVQQMSYNDICTVQVTRSQILSLLSEPYFHDYLKGLYVRVNAGYIPNTRENCYRVCRVDEIIHKKEHYVVDGINCSILLLLSFGSFHKNWEIKYISNDLINEKEYNEYVDSLKQNEDTVPTTDDIVELHKQKEKMKQHVYTDREVEDMVRKNLENMDVSKINIVNRKAEIKTSLQEYIDKLTIVNKTLSDINENHYVDQTEVERREDEKHEIEHQIRKLQEEMKQLITEEKRRLQVIQGRMNPIKVITEKHRETNRRTLYEAQQITSQTHNAFKRSSTIPSVSYILTDSTKQDSTASNSVQSKDTESKDISVSTENEKKIIPSIIHKVNNNILYIYIYIIIFNSFSIYIYIYTLTLIYPVLPSMSDIHNFTVDINVIPSPSTTTSTSSNINTETPKPQVSKKRNGMSLSDYVAKLNERNA